MVNLAKRITLVSSSPTLGITAKVNQLRSQGIEVIGFGAGEPDFDTPGYIKEEAIRALQEGFTKYTATSGISELKKAIINKLQQDNSLTYTEQEIIVSCGAKHSLYNVIQVLCQKGDEVILASPYWVSYLEMIKLSSAKPVIVKTKEKENFKFNIEKLKKKISTKTKLLILNSPANPTGTVYTKEELEEIAQLATRHNFFVISDEIYEKLIYDGLKHLSLASLNPQIKNLTIVINGVSKTYAMTGWRIGYAAGAKEIVQAMSNLQDHSTSNPTSFAQRAAVTAINGPQDEAKKMVEEFKNRRDYMVQKINSIKKISCFRPQGAFYVFVNISKLLKKNINGFEIKDSLSLTEFFLNEAKVAVVPGIVFGDDHYIRLSYATSMENIQKGLARLEEIIKRYF